MRKSDAMFRLKCYRNYLNTQLKYELGKAREKLDKIGLLADIAISIMK